MGPFERGSLLTMKDPKQNTRLGPTQLSSASRFRRLMEPTFDNGVLTLGRTGGRIASSLSASSTTRTIAAQESGTYGGQGKAVRRQEAPTALLLEETVSIED